MTAAADPTANDTATPVPASERIAALDVLRGFALLGIFIMNMPGFTHSLFAAPTPEPDRLDALVAGLRELLFAGKFNLLFGLVFGIGFALQMRRFDAAEARAASTEARAIDRHRSTRRYARRLVFLLAVGLVHAILVWPGDVLVIYALIGFALLALRRVADRTLIALIVACLLFPAVAEVVRTTLFSIQAETVAAFQYQQLEASNDLAFGHGSLLDAVRETAHVFAWSYSTPFGLYAYASYYVQMGTGILAGYLLGRRGWPGRTTVDAKALRRLLRIALALTFAGTAIATLAAGGASGEATSVATVFVATLARTIGRAALAAAYALTVVRLVRGPVVPGWLLPLEQAGRMPLSNYLLQTLLATSLFYGWGLGLWGSAGPASETLLAVLLFLFVQLPLSAWWLARFRYGPMERLWRRFTYPTSPR